MTRKDYRAAFDAVQFSPDFRQRTLARLAEAGRTDEKETQMMKAKRTRRTLVLAVALAAALVVSAAAAALLLTPKDVAENVGDGALAAAFAQEGALAVNETVESEGYRITLSGLVSGAGLSAYSRDVDESRTYAVLALSRTDGTPVEGVPIEGPGGALVVTPLVAGYEPWRLNAWTLGGGYSSFALDGVAYYLFDYQDIEVFADRTVYLAAYEGFTPSADLFSMGEDGGIAFTDTVEGPHALFTLPLDPAGADADAAARILENCGIESNG